MLKFKGICIDLMLELADCYGSSVERFYSAGLLSFLVMLQWHYSSKPAHIKEVDQPERSQWFEEWRWVIRTPSSAYKAHASFLQ